MISYFLQNLEPYTNLNNKSANVFAGLCDFFILTLYNDELKFIFSTLTPIQSIDWATPVEHHRTK
ncbi:MAG TPA: hypothetical protein DHV28_04825 [Ignavibacteriales bacterium]|nr:hypothetical protein [Ignavibacteriales bacterium]